jgi:hypothetical protein
LLLSSVSFFRLSRLKYIYYCSLLFCLTFVQCCCLLSPISLVSHLCNASLPCLFFPPLLSHIHTLFLSQVTLFRLSCLSIKHCFCSLSPFLSLMSLIFSLPLSSVSFFPVTCLTFAHLLLCPVSLFCLSWLTFIFSFSLSEVFTFSTHIYTHLSLLFRWMHSELLEFIAKLRDPYTL